MGPGESCAQAGHPVKNIAGPIYLTGRKPYLSPMENADEIIEMALSDKVPFRAIKELYGLDESQVKKLMKSRLRRGSYNAWRKRVQSFSSQRISYK